MGARICMWRININDHTEKSPGKFNSGYGISNIWTPGLYFPKWLFGWGSIQSWQQFVQFLPIFILKLFFNWGSIRIFNGWDCIQLWGLNTVAMVLVFLFLYHYTILKNLYYTNSGTMPQKRDIHSPILTKNNSKIISFVHIYASLNAMLA